MQADTKVMDIDKLLNDFARACAFGDDAAARTQAGQAIKDALSSRAASPLPVAASVSREDFDRRTEDLTRAKNLLVRLWNCHPAARTQIEGATGSWFAWGTDRDAAPLDTSTTAAPTMHLVDGTSNPEWLSYKHTVLNPAIDAAAAAPTDAPTTPEVWSALRVFHHQETPSHFYSMEAALKAFLEGRGQTASAQAVPPVAPTEAEGYDRAEWIALAKQFYIEAGDDEATALACAQYICNEQDWVSAFPEQDDPREAAQEDVRGRDRPKVPGSSKDLNTIHAVIMNIGGDWPEVEGDSHTVYHVKRMARELNAKSGPKKDPTAVADMRAICAYEAAIPDGRPFSLLPAKQQAMYYRIAEAVLTGHPRDRQGISGSKGGAS